MPARHTRELKPGFFVNEELGALPPLTRLFFQGLWCWADRNGRVEDRPRRLKAEILPYDPEADGEAMVASLAAAGFLIRYEAEGVRYLQVVNFDKHQRPHPREEKGKIPGPAQGDPRADLGQSKDSPRACKSALSLLGPSEPSEPSTIPPTPQADPPPVPPPQPASLGEERPVQLDPRELRRPARLGPGVPAFEAWTHWITKTWPQLSDSKPEPLTTQQAQRLAELCGRHGPPEVCARMDRAAADEFWSGKLTLGLFLDHIERFAPRKAGADPPKQRRGMTEVGTDWDAKPW